MAMQGPSSKTKSNLFQITTKVVKKCTTIKNGKILQHVNKFQNCRYTTAANGTSAGTGSRHCIPFKIIARQRYSKESNNSMLETIAHTITSTCKAAFYICQWFLWLPFCKIRNLLFLVLCISPSTEVLLYWSFILVSSQQTHVRFYVHRYLCQYLGTTYPFGDRGNGTI